MTLLGIAVGSESDENDVYEVAMNDAVDACMHNYDVRACKVSVASRAERTHRRAGRVLALKPLAGPVTHDNEISSIRSR